MKTDNPIKSVVHAANMLGAIAEHPLLPRNIAAKATEVWESADIDSLINEHAALCAVAEASKELLAQLIAAHIANPDPQFVDVINKAQANLATLAQVRESGVSK